MLESVGGTSHRSSLTTHSNRKMTARYRMEIHGDLVEMRGFLAVF
jgi:hypothetical protein